MSLKPHYNCDSEFFKLITRRPDVDLTAAVLEVARDAYPNLDFQTTFEWIENRVRELAGPVAKAHAEIDALKELGRCLCETHGIRGDSDAFDLADSSYLNRVIETGRGIPISLSVLYMAVAERLGVELKGVSTPMHFLTRYESVDGPIFLDAYAGGRLLKLDECADWIASISQLPISHVHRTLKPVDARSIVIRMLNNLKTLHARQENWSAAWVVQHRLTTLQPVSYQERRDLAVIALKANDPGTAFDLIKSCLRNCPDEDRSSLELHLVEAQRELARWN